MLVFFDALELCLGFSGFTSGAGTLLTAFALSWFGVAAELELTGDKLGVSSCRSTEACVDRLTSLGDSSARASKSV